MVRMHFLRRTNWSAINTPFARWMTCIPRSALHVHNSLITHLSVAKLGIQCLNKLKRNEEWLPGFETQHCIWKNTDDSLEINMTVQYSEIILPLGFSSFRPVTTDRTSHDVPLGFPVATIFVHDRHGDACTCCTPWVHQVGSIPSQHKDLLYNIWNHINIYIYIYRL